jgi:hypothetical protein
MSTRVFSARLIVGQETTFFGYPRGLNGKCAVNASDASEEIKKATNVRTCTKIMTLKARVLALSLRRLTHRWALLFNNCKCNNMRAITLFVLNGDDYALISLMGSL